MAAAGKFTADSVASVAALWVAVHPGRVGRSLAWSAMHGEVFKRVASFVLVPLGRFSASLPQGRRVELETDGLGMKKLRLSRKGGWEGRLESTACGAQAVAAGVAEWTVTCTGERFMVGVLPDALWPAFQEADPSYVPFVCNGGRNGAGFGVGLLCWDGLFLCRQSHPDKRLGSAEGLPEGACITVTLDLERHLVAFAVRGGGDECTTGTGASLCSAPIGVGQSYRFAASIYGVGAAVRFVRPDWNCLH